MLQLEIDLRKKSLANTLKINIDDIDYNERIDCFLCEDELRRFKAFTYEELDDFFVNLFVSNIEELYESEHRIDDGMVEDCIYFRENANAKSRPESQTLVEYLLEHWGTEKVFEYFFGDDKSFRENAFKEIGESYYRWYNTNEIASTISYDGEMLYDEDSNYYIFRV